MKITKLLFIPLFIVSLSSCDAFENPGNIEDYVGTYVVASSHEKKYHVYWNQKELISETNIKPDIGTKIIIKSDKKVEFIMLDGTVKNGSVKCLEKYVRFLNTPIESSYKFYLRYDHSLNYSWESKHASAEYDVTYRSISLQREN